MDIDETDRLIEEFIKIRSDKDEIKILKRYPAMLGDLINFSIREHKE